MKRGLAVVMLLGALAFAGCRQADEDNESH